MLSGKDGTILFSQPEIALLLCLVNNLVPSLPDNIDFLTPVQSLSRGVRAGRLS